MWYIGSMKLADKAYLAGLIDGEAYVGITRSATGSAKGCKRGVAYRVMVSIAMTNRAAIDYARFVSGVGTIYSRRRPTNPKHSQAWTWNVWSRQAVGLLRQIEPYLKVKGNAARSCIEFQAAMRYPGKNGLSDEEWANRERLWKKTKVRV